MKAWLLEKLDGLQSLRLAEVPNPQPAAGEALLALRFAALNPADRYLAEDQYPAHPPLPHILGRDGAGEVIAVGSGADPALIGQRRLVLRSEIGVNRPGTFAERVAVPVDCLAPIPSGWSLDQAGTALVYLTAWQALTQWGKLAPSVVLVNGASGGVGVACVQLATLMGHSVVVLSRSPEKQKRLLQLGAMLALDPLDPRDGGWTKTLLASLAGRKVDLAIDNIGGNLLNEMIATLGDQGKVSLVGRLAGPVPQFNTATLFSRRLRLGGVAVGTFTHAQAQQAWQSIVQTLSQSSARPLIDAIFPFDQLPQAFDHLVAGPMGKVLLAIQP